MKPKSASDILRQLSPRKVIGTSFFSGNRFNTLRDHSPASSIRSTSSFRNRSVSAKRKASDDGLSYAAVTGNPTSSAQCNDDLLNSLNLRVGMVRSVCENAAIELKKEAWEPSIVNLFEQILEALRITSDIQTDIIGNFSKSTPVTGNTRHSLPDAHPKRLRAAGNLTNLQVPKQQAPRIQKGNNVVDNDNVEPTVQKFKDAVRAAEKSSLLLNLDLGKVPIMNQNTISAKATGALTTMAAVTEGKNSCVPSEEAVTAIDDVLSMVKSMQFFGKTTKSYKNAKDPKSGAYCTIPVKYEFKDKDTRIRAETILREKCKVHCSTPYPTILRETIRQVINHVKHGYPDNQVRVNVDLKNMGLKVCRRPPMVEGRLQYRKEHDRLLPIPAEAFDVGARKVPDNFVVRDLPDSPVKVTPMATDHSPGSKSPPRLSRIDGQSAGGIASNNVPPS